MGPAGLVLAGGLSRRMGGGDKALSLLAGRPILAHVLERMRPQLGPLALSANGDPARFSDFGLPVLPDPVPDHAGPLAGILAGLEWASRECRVSKYLVSIPSDTPFLPDDLVARLDAARQSAGAQIAIAASGGRLHPVVGLWPLALASDLRRALLEEGIGKVELFVRRHPFAVAEFPVVEIDPFFNINQPEDLVTAAGHISGNTECG